MITPAELRTVRLTYRQRMAKRQLRAAKLKRSGELMTSGPMLQGGIFSRITPWFVDRDGLPTRQVGDLENMNGP
jgi:hypothetical protein